MAKIHVTPSGGFAIEDEARAALEAEEGWERVDVDLHQWDGASHIALIRRAAYRLILKMEPGYTYEIRRRPLPKGPEGER